MKKIVKTFVLLFAMANMISCDLLDPKPTEETDKFKDYRVYKIFQTKFCGPPPERSTIFFSYIKEKVVQPFKLDNKCGSSSQDMQSYYGFFTKYSDKALYIETYTDKSTQETNYELNNKGFVAKGIDNNGDVTNFTYSNSDLLTKIEYKTSNCSDCSYLLNITWENENPIKIEKIQDGFTRTYLLEYDKNLLDTRNLGVFYEGKYPTQTLISNSNDEYVLADIQQQVVDLFKGKNAPTKLTIIRGRNNQVITFNYERDENDFITKCVIKGKDFEIEKEYEYIKVK